MFPLPNFDDPVFDEVRRGAGGKFKGKLKRRASKRAQRDKAAKRAGGGRPKRARASR